MKDQAAEATVAAVAKNVTLSAGGVAVYGGWTANEVAAFGGLVIGLLGLIVQIYYKRKADKREREADARDREAHAERLAYLRRGKGE